VSTPTKQQRSSASEEAADFVRKLRLRPLQIAKAIGAVATFAATVTGLLFGLWPALKPTDPPATKGAALSNATVDRVRFGQYLDRDGRSRSPYGSALLERRGALVGFDLNVKGYLNKRLPLRLQLLDARTGDQVNQARDFSFIPRATDDHNSLSFWMPVPSGRDRRFYVEVQLLDNRGAIPLGRIRTNRFSGT
jgi:hypothetical protein